MSRNIHEPSLYRQMAGQRSLLRGTRRRPGAFRWWVPDCDPNDPSQAKEGCSGDEPSLINGFAQPTSGLEPFGFRLNADGKIQTKGFLDVSGATSGDVAWVMPGANPGEVDFIPSTEGDDGFSLNVTTTGNVNGVVPASAHVDADTGEVTVTWTDPGAEAESVCGYIAWYEGIALPANDWYLASFDWEEAFVSNAASGIIEPYTSGFGILLPVAAPGATAGSWLIDVNAVFFQHTDGPPVAGDWFGLQLRHFDNTSWYEFDSAIFQPANMINTHVWDHDFDLVVHRYRQPATLNGYFEVEIGNFCGTKQMWLDSLQLYVTRLSPGMDGTWTYQ